MIQKYNEAFLVSIFLRIRKSRPHCRSRIERSLNIKNVHSIMKGKKMGTEAGTRWRNRQFFP